MPGLRSSGSGKDSEQVAPGILAKDIEEYLADHPAAAVLEEGRILFDMRDAHYSVSESHGRCVLQLWSQERNLIRTVVGVQARAQCLRVMTRRMGAPRPQALELVPTSDRRTPSARDTTRRTYQRVLERALTRVFIGYKVDALSSAMDLEHSFGPAYVRGRLLKGTAADAVIAVGEAESATMVDGILTLGLLWLDRCRTSAAAEGRRHFGGLKVVVPPATWRTTAERMAWLNQTAAEFQLYTLDERSEELIQVDFRDIGNLQSRLVHAFSPAAAIERCRAAIDRVFALLPDGAKSCVEIRPHSASEVGLQLYGLEFARARHKPAAHSFGHETETTFGAGPNETPLIEENEALARALFARLFRSRHPHGAHTDALFRLQPEHWLEARLRGAIDELLPGLRGDMLYSQVPALSSSDRGMLDLLTLDRNGRLTVIELKADEDLHLPLQALDYWIRVRSLNDDRQPAPGGMGRPLSAFERQGYFAGAEVSATSPRLLLAAPALRIHPANEPVLRYFSTQIEWELIALSEHWRQELKVVFHKRAHGEG